MNLTQIKGNTYVIEATQFIPLYRLPDDRCILLDSGLVEEREQIEQTILGAGLTLAGILCSHAHVDHCGNSAYFQGKYHIPVALTREEAGMCASLLTLKCYFLTLPLSMVERESSCMVHTPDVIIPPEDGPFSFAGAEFRIVHTPGHSAGHISIITPDNVCYTADAVLSQEMLNAKLPYNLNHQMAMDSREKLRDLGCDTYIMAHRGVCSQFEIGELIRVNQVLTRRRAREVLELIRRPMTAHEIEQAVCKRFELLSHRPRRGLRYERNTRFMIEFLVDNGFLEMESRQGVVYYCPRGLR